MKSNVHHEISALLLAVLLLPATHGLADTANTAAVVSAAATFKGGLNSTQQAFIDSTSSPVNSSCQYNLLLSNVEVWSNVPISTTLSGATRNGLIFSGLTAGQQTNALAVATAALSTTGKKLFDDVRAGDRYISGEVTNAKGTTSAGWGYNKYFLGFVGAPSTSTAFSMQLGGHHAAFNITYNGTYTSGTPLFAGTEPNSWTDSTGTYAPLGAQRTQLELLRPTLTASALLSGTFSDVVFGPNGSGPGATGSHDTTQPKAYPTSGRGQLYSALTATQQGYVKTYIETWVNFLHPSIASELLAIYESPQALAETYVGYAGSNTLMRASANYFRVDGPRLWIEFSVQGGVYDMTSYHDHGVFRDKLADYGAAYGATTISTTFRPPTVSIHPSNQTPATGGSAAFSVVAASAGTGTATLSYQWYKDSAAIAGATSSIYNIASASAADVGSYYATVVSTGGFVKSNSATLAIVSPPVISTASPLTSGIVGIAYSQALAATGGTSPYTWTVDSGSAPTNLTLTSGGVLGGNPTAAGTFIFTAKVTDSASLTATKSLSVTISEPVTTYLSSHGLAADSWTVDSDHDGIANLAEFILGGDPTVGDPSILPTFIRGSTALTYAFNVPVNPGSVTWKVQYTADLSGTWTPAVSGTDGVTITTTSASVTANHVSVDMPATDAKRFVRLSITGP